MASELEDIRESIADVVAALQRAQEEVEGLRRSTGSTSSQVKEVLGGSATAVDKEMVSHLEDAERSAGESERAIEDAVHELRRASETL